jgi:hypothetical protein
MTLGLSSTVANGFLNALCRAANYTAPTAFYIKLHTGDPGSAGASNAATETTRKAVTFGTAASGGSIANTVAVTWTTVAGSEDFSHYSIWDASTAGNYLGSGLITANAVTAGDDFTLAIGAVVLALTVAA